jgi:DNA-binding response OmpR family regulator
MSKVLVLEDEASIRSFILVNLKRHGFHVLETDSGEEALRIMKEHRDIELALLDVMLPGIDGFEVCRRIRESNERMGIIFLTAKVQEQDKVMALSIGADDYIGKPFSPAELMARVHSLLRRVKLLHGTAEPGSADTALLAGPFRLQLPELQLMKDGQPIDLTPTEGAIVRFLMTNRGQALSRDKLLDEVWGAGYIGDPKIVDVNIRRLRQKIETDPSKPTYIETVWGLGYRWKEEQV